MLITNKTYNISGNIDKTIVLISDIHYSNKKDIKHLYKVFNKIQKINPNYICISGDLIDNTYIKDEDYLINWIKKLGTICNVLISIGNHEFCINKKKNEYGFNKELYKKIESINNIYVLDNSNIILDNINFIGLTLPFEHYYYNEESITSFNKYLYKFKTNKKYYNVLLCHTPFNICNEEIVKKLNVDLVLCGHTHGGVVPKFLRGIIKTSGFINPQKKLFPKNVYGNIKINNTNIIITSGISVLPKKIGILTNLCSSEIVTIKIK